MKGSLWKIAISVLVSGVLPLGATLFGHWYPVHWFGDWTWNFGLLHSSLELLGSFSALALGFFLILVSKQKRVGGPYLWISFSLIAMGTLDLFHANLASGNPFVWLRSISTLIGGTLFAMVWLPDRFLRPKPTFIPPLLIIGAVTVLAIVSLLVPESLPLMITQSGFTSVAKAVNAFGGVLFLTAGSFFLYHYRMTGQGDYPLWFNLSLLFGVAGLMFPMSTAWDFSWWLWHLLRVTAYLLSLMYVFTSYSSLYEESRNTVEVYRSLLSSTPDAIVMYDLQGRTQYVNESFAKTFGWTMDDLAGKGVPYTPDSEREATMAHVRRVVEAGGFVSRFETKRSTKDRRLLDISMSASRFNDHEGNPAGMVVILRDITESKGAEEQLRKSEEKYRTILENIEEGYYEVDLAGNMTFCNESLSRIHGYTAQELIGMNNRQFMAADTQKAVYKEFNTVYETGKPARMSDWEIIRKDGTRRTVEGSVSLVNDSEGKPCGFRGVVTDVTDRKKAEQALLRSEELQRTILTTSPVGIGLAVDRKMVWVNDAWNKIFGFEPDDADGVLRSARELYPTQEEFERVGKVVYEGLEAGQVNETDAKMIRKDGSPFDAHIRMRAVEPSDLSNGTIAALTDITEHLELSRQLVQAQKMESIGTLTGGIAHDFNNLLTIINGYTEMVLSEKTEDDPSYSDLQKVLQTGRKGAELVKRLLTLSKKGESSPQPLDLNRVVEDSVDLMERTFPKMIEIETILAKDLGYGQCRCRTSRAGSHEPLHQCQGSHAWKAVGSGLKREIPA